MGLTRRLVRFLQYNRHVQTQENEVSYIMKAKELIEIFKQAPEAEVGYEHLAIHNAWVDSDDYIELDGQTERSKYENQKSGVFVVLTEYEDNVPEVNGIYTTLCRAEKMKSWLEKCPTKEENGYGNIKRVIVRNMFILS